MPRKKQAYCSKGHLLSPDNLYHSKISGAYCKKCQIARVMVKYVPRPRAPKLVCKVGHPYTGYNKATQKGTGYYYCRQCHVDSVKRGRMRARIYLAKLKRMLKRMT